MPQPQSWGEVYSLHTSVSVAGDFGRREFAIRLPSTAIRCTDPGQAAQVRDVGPVKIARQPRPTFGDEFA